MKRWLPISAGIVLVLLAGVAHGVWSNRWGNPSELNAATERLAQVPKVIGDWTGQELELNPRVLEIGEIAGYVHRRYENRLTGQVVKVLLVCGKSGPIAAHTPDICYGGIGFHLVAKPTRYTLPTADTFWTAQVRKQDSHQTANLRVWWAWNATDHWEAPDNPRLKFGRFPALYKLYVVRELTAGDESPDPGTIFLQRLVPELQRSLGSNRVP